MNIQSLSSPPRGISVTDAIAPAYERVKQMLFKPFDLSKWITIGFGAWLAGFGESGGSGGLNGFNGGGNNQGQSNAQPAEQLRHFYHESSDFVLANLVWLIPATLALVLVVTAVWLVMLWLSCRGKFMFLHCVALNKAEVVVPWVKFASAANSLFWFRLVLGLFELVLMLPLLGFIAMAILRMVLQGEPDVAGVLTTMVLGLGFILLALGFALVHKLLVDFVAPIMFLHGEGCLSAWREFCTLLAANLWEFALYFLFQIVLSLAIGVLVLLAILLTCCMAGCLLALPFIGTVLLLPVLIFQRSYPLYYLAQFGPRYDVFPAPAAGVGALT